MPVPSTQPDPVLEVIAGRNTFRINQEVDSGGALFEVPTSILNAYVGPQSDFSQYNLTYYDPQRASGLNQTVVASDTEFAGRLDALLATSVPSTGQPARILATTNDLYFPGGPDLDLVETTEITLIRPNFDLVFAIGPVDNPPAKRADRTYYLPDNRSGGGGVSAVRRFVAVPFYGRALCTCNVQYPEAVDQNLLMVHAYAFDFEAGSPQGYLNFLQSATVSEFSPEPKTISLTSAQVGFHDYLLFELLHFNIIGTTLVPFPTDDPTGILTIVVSDRT